VSTETSGRLWHRLGVDAALAALHSDAARGLSPAEAAERLLRYGENRLAEAEKRPAWRKFLDQFRNLLVIVLLFAAALAWGIGDVKDAVVILCVVLLNASLGFYQEYRAERTLVALKGMLAAQARVRRDGLSQNLPACQLVPGDIVLLEAGDQIPADGRLLAAHNLEVIEAALTGESHAVGKSTAALDAGELPLGDRINLLYMNTVVTRGRAELLVTATGMHTEMGRAGRHDRRCRVGADAVAETTRYAGQEAGRHRRPDRFCNIHPRSAARPALGGIGNDCRRPGGGGDSGRLAGGGDGDAGDRHVADGTESRHSEKTGGGGNPGFHHGDLFRQNRHPDAEPDDRARRLVCRQPLQCQRRGLCAAGQNRRLSSH
jgi:hypothetical protein